LPLGSSSPCSVTINLCICIRFALIVALHKEIVLLFFLPSVVFAVVLPLLLSVIVFVAVAPGVPVDSNILFNNYALFIWPRVMRSRYK